MQLRIQTSLPRFGYDLAADLEKAGFGQVQVFAGSADTFELRHRPSVRGSDITRLLEALKPLQPTHIQPDSNIDGADAVISLGGPQPFNTWEVRIDCDSPELAAQVREISDDLGFRDLGTRIGVQDADVLQYAGADTFARQVIRWRMKQLGIKLKEQRQTGWSDTDDDIWLQFRDPLHSGRPIIERFDVRIISDEPLLAEKLRDRLKAAGFRVPPVEHLSTEDARDKAVTLTPGPFGADRAPTGLARITVFIQDLLSESGIDVTKYPLRVLAESDGPAAEIVLPLAACKVGIKKPYSGPYPERFTVTLHTDQPERAAPLREALQAKGFTSVEFSGLTTDDLNRGFALHWGAAGKEPEIARILREAVEKSMDGIRARPPFELAVSDQFTPDDADVWIYFPIQAVDDGTLLDRLSDPGRFKLTLHSPDPSAWADLLADWQKWGFQGCTSETSDVKRPQIDFGGAPHVLLERVRDSIRTAGEIDAPVSKRWEDEDTDIWVYLPARTTAAKVAASTWETEAFDVRSWFAHQLEVIAEPARHFVEVAAEKVRVGSVVLPRRKPRGEPFVPDADGFSHFCLDARTAETLAHVALSVALREPCLLEGETSTSKTSSILYLAALLGQPVVRINLNGQTDTGELVGRYVPRDSDTAVDDNSNSTPDQRSQWRWQDGPVVTALKRGWWVLLDEVNLAEPQILERLNSVLEREPTLVLTEHDHSAFGPGGQAIHPDFRIFATMNPAEYAGRSVLSPAYRDRWRAHRHIPQPTEAEYLAMLQYLVHGRQPEVTVQGRPFTGSSRPAPLGVLAGQAGIDELLPGLASFHAALEHAAGQSETDAARIGGRRKERYVFTRRGLLSVMEYLASPFAIGGVGKNQRPLRESLLRYYLGRVGSPEDQRLIVQLLDAAGLAPDGGQKPRQKKVPKVKTKTRRRTKPRRRPPPKGGEEIPF